MQFLIDTEKREKKNSKTVKETKETVDNRKKASGKYAVRC